jgi:hypothetical protein
MTTTELTLEEAAEAAEALFASTMFSGFRFDTGFTLYFWREGPAELKGQPLPHELRLEVDSPIAIEDGQSWEERMAALAPRDAAQPDAPVVAYELARLRWVEGSEVARAELNERELAITLRCGARISIACSAEREDWILSAGPAPSEWVLVWEFGSCFLSGAAA